MQAKTVEAIAAFEQAVKLRPDLHEAHFAPGVARGSRGQLEAAAAAFREAIRVNPELVGAEDQIRIDQGRDAAVAAFREAIRNLPRPAAAERAVVVKLAQNERPAVVAPPDRNEGSRLDPEAAGHIDRGIGWITRNDCDKAIGEFNEAIRLEPGVSVAYIHRGFAWSSKREYAKAIADYDKAVQLDPQSAAAYNDRAGCGQLARSPRFATATRRLNRRSGPVRFWIGSNLARWVRWPRPMQNRAISARP